MNRRAEVKQRRPGIHFRLRDFPGLGLALGFPAVAARHDPRGAVFGGKVAEREHRLDLQRRLRPRHIGPGGFVVMQFLLRFARPYLDQLAGVQQVVPAVRQQEMIGGFCQQRVQHEFDEGVGLGRQAVDANRRQAVKLDDFLVGGVPEAGRYRIDETIQFGIEPRQLPG